MKLNIKGFHSSSYFSACLMNKKDYQLSQNTEQKRDENILVPTALNPSSCSLNINT